MIYRFFIDPLTSLLLRAFNFLDGAWDDDEDDPYPNEEEECE